MSLKKWWVVSVLAWKKEGKKRVPNADYQKVETDFLAKLRAELGLTHATHAEFRKAEAARKQNGRALAARGNVEADVDEDMLDWD